MGLFYLIQPFDDETAGAGSSGTEDSGNLAVYRLRSAVRRIPRLTRRGATIRAKDSGKTSLAVDRNQFQGSEIHQVMIEPMLRIKPEEDLALL